MRKWLNVKAVVAFGALVVLLTLGAAAASAKRGAQTVTISALWTTEQSLGFDILVKNFENVYPNIKVNVSYVPQANIAATLATQIQAGNEPDLFEVNQGNQNGYSVFPLAAQGKLLAVGGPWVKHVDAKSIQYFSRKHRLYGNPFFFTPFAVMANVDLFKKIGATYPKSFSQLLSLCAKARANGLSAIANGLANNNGQTQLTYMAMEAFVYNKDPDFTLHLAQKKTTWSTSPLARNALNALVQMKDANCFEAGQAGTTSTSSEQQFETGNALMVTTTIAGYGRITTAMPSLHNPVAAPFPAASANDTVVVHLPLGLSGSATTKYPAAVRDFINFMGRPKQAALYANMSGAIPGYEALKGTLTTLNTTYAPTFYSLFGPLMKAGKSVPLPGMLWPRADLPITFGTEMVGLFTGQKTVDQVLSDMDAAWNTKPG